MDSETKAKLLDIIVVLNNKKYWLDKQHDETGCLQCAAIYCKLADQLAEFIFDLTYVFPNLK